MVEPVEIPAWLNNLPLAPEYRPTETEFTDPIAFISRIEREAAAFGICKVIPPLPRPSKKFVLANLNRSLSTHPDHSAPPPAAPSPGAADAVFTTRHQELGARRGRPLSVQKRVWQSGEFYTLDQFEAKSKAFARAQLGGLKEANPLLIETLFWKAAAEKPIYVEYANDVPGSGFGVPEEPFRYNLHRRKKQKRGLDRGNVQQPKGMCTQTSGEQEGTSGAGWKLSNSPWNLQVIARSPGSLTRFMPDEVPGVTSPMVYVGMLFSWFAWHVEDHELHSMNFLHMGSPKTWYAVPGDYAATLEEIVRIQGYGGNMDRLASLIMLGEKTTLLSPEVLVTAKVPCCRLVQHPGEFVITFPRAYHVGFSHGFNCGEAANFATPKWLTVAKEAAVRRAAMNFLPMLSHQQLLYLLSISFISSIPRGLLSGSRSSRLRDRKKEEREVLVKKAFLDDMMHETKLLFLLLAKATISSAVLWEPELLPSTCQVTHPHCSSLLLEAHDINQIKTGCESMRKDLLDHEGDACCKQDVNAPTTNVTPYCAQPAGADENASDAGCMNAHVAAPDDKEVDEVDLPFDINVDSGSLACVACGILGYPFMTVLQPSEEASGKLFALNLEESNPKLDKSHNSDILSYRPCSVKNPHLEEICDDAEEQSNPDCSANSIHVVENPSAVKESSSHAIQNFISQQVDTSKSGRMTEPCISLLPISNESNEKDCQFLNPVENQLGELRPQGKTDTCVQIKRPCDYSHETRPDNINGQHSCDGVREPVQHISVKNNALVDSELCQTDFGGTMPPNVTEKLGASERKCSDDITGWNTSNGFLRPRIFCLQHALEVENLLQSKGGARVLVICHSDYLKIKAIAISIAEEINIQFNCDDVSLVNASRSDLELINISIDEERHEEDGNDWTSKMGLNLKYCVKLKKQMPSNHEYLTLSLGGIFSDPSVSVIPNLKWLSRKSRTPYKVVGIIQSKSQFHPNSAKYELIDKNSKKVDSAKATKVYHNLKYGPDGMKTKHQYYLGKSVPEESDSGNKTVKSDADDDEKGKCSAAEKVGSQIVEGISANLHNVPILIAEYPQRHQLNYVTLEVSTYSSSEGSPDIHSNNFSKESNAMKAASSQPSVSSEMSHGVEETYGPTNKFDSSGKSKFPTDTLTLEGGTSAAIQQANLEEELDGSRNSSCEPGTRPLRNYEILDNLENSCGRYLLSENQLLLPTDSKINSDIRLDDSVKLKRMFGICVTDGDKMQHGSLDRTDNIMKGDNLFTINNSAGNHSEVLQDDPCIDQLKISSKSEDREPDMQTDLDSSMKLGENVVMPVVESSIAQKLCENTRDVCASAEITSLLLNDIRSVNRYPARAHIIQYVRRRKKRKTQHEQSSCDDRSVSFVRGPCEGLRPRTQPKADYKADAINLESSIIMGRRRPGNSAVQREDKSKTFNCDIEGCFMSFDTKGELSLHKRNRCCIAGCGKRFSNHKYAARHQCVHNDARPLKCPWKGCSMTFKWAWARTEHVRVHTGERPYKCKISGCGQTFRFVSDISRHRRKTGHYVTPAAG